jgi:hypothetical protein
MLKINHFKVMAFVKSIAKDVFAGSYLQMKTRSLLLHQKPVKGTVKLQSFIFNSLDRTVGD